MLSTSFLNKVFVILFAFFLYLSGCTNTRVTTKKEFHTDEGKLRIAVFPVENLSGAPAPIKEIRQSLISALKKDGFHVLEEEVLEKFMAKHRIRYTGGLDTAVAQAFKQEIGTEAVLITSLKLFSDAVPPKIGLTSRLVSTGNNPVILWMDGIGLAGDDSPGILGLGLIEDPKILQKKALGFISDSLIGYLSRGEESTEVKGVKRKFQPKITYHSPEMSSDKRYTVAVIPFFNRSDRKNAGEILVLHFVTELTKLGKFDVIELGVVRQKLLNVRVIMNEGISLADADLVANSLDADLILTGKIINYQDYKGAWGRPKVQFSIVVIERKSRKVVWNSDSYNEGDDGVYFFDWGRVNTAYVMALNMVRAVAKMMVK